MPNDLFCVAIVIKSYEPQAVHIEAAILLVPPSALVTIGEEPPDPR